MPMPLMCAASSCNYFLTNDQAHDIDIHISHFTQAHFLLHSFLAPKKWVIHSRVHNKGNSTTVYILLLNSMRSMVMVYIRINITFRPFWKFVRKFSIYRAWLYFYSLMAKAVLMHPNNNDSGSSDKKKHHRRIM